MITTCGFVNTNYDLWGSFAQFMFVFVVIIGGCMGSTSGGIKIFRLKILFQMLHAQIKRLVRPHGVFRAQYEHKSLSEDVLSSVACYFFVFLFTLFIATLLLAITGLDILTSFSSAAALLGNSGPGLGNISGPAGNYASYSDFALYVGSFTMLLGRLEILAFLALLGKTFWRE
jgi:trk system potassium uptake protein TrkH